MATPDQLNNPAIKKSAAPEATPLNVINKLGQESWVIINKSDDVEMKLHFSAMNEHERLWAQKLLLNAFPYTDARHTLHYSHGTLLNMVQSIRRVFVYLQEQSDGKQKLKNWTIGDAGKMIQYIAVKGGTLLSSGIPRSVVKILKESYSVRYQQDGISFSLPATFLQQVMSPLCIQFDMTYSQWERGGSHGMVPMPVATLLLADAIKLIRSKECQILQCYFTSFRKGLVTQAMIMSCDKRGKVGKVGKSIFNCNISQFLKPSKDNPLTSVNPHAKADKKRADFVKKLHEISPELTDFPFKNHIQITEFVNEIEGACLTILLAVTAMRISECHSIGADWMDAIEYLDVNGVWTKDAILKSKIIKTGGGIIAKRGLSPLGIETFELLNTLSWVDKKKLGLQLFSYTYAGVWLNKNTDTYKAHVALSRLRMRLKEYYQEFVERAHQSVKEAFPDIVPHNLRHLKMAFGLRKFDGNVEEAIKQEFRHHGHHTQSYSRNKLNETEAALVRRSYAEDIIKRILINNPSDKWAGPSAKKIRVLAEKLLHGLDIEMLSLEALADFHEKIHKNIHSMIMHSYGMCFVLNDSVHVAKCGVNDCIVRTGAANSKLCHGCTNFCVNNKSHEHDMAMNKRRWNATANSELIASFPIVTEAKAMVRKIEQLEAELLDTCDE